MIFADEPTGNLDSRSGGEILAFLRRAVDELGQTIVMVTHDPVAAAYADAVVFLADGRASTRCRPSPPSGCSSASRRSGADRHVEDHDPQHRRPQAAPAATSSAVVLGVAFLSGTLVLGDTMETGFGDMFDEANAGTDAIVRSSTEVGDEDISERGLLDAPVVDDVAAVDGVAAVPRSRDRPDRRIRRRSARGQRPAHPGRELDRRSRDQPLADRRRPRPEGPGEVVVDKASADDGDLQVGDATTIRTSIPST